jgi:hypothetical protein
MAITDPLNRFPRVKHVVHHSADRTIRVAARAGIDLNRRRVRAGDFAIPASGRLAFTQTRAATLVPVSGPAAAFDLEPAGFSDLCERTARGYSLPATGLLEIRGGRFHLPSGVVTVDGRLPSELIPVLHFPHAFQVVPTLQCLRASATAVPDGVLINLQMSNSFYHWTCEILPRALSAASVAGAGARLYLCQQLPRFVFESLELLGLAGQCVALPTGVYTAERLAVPSYERAEWPAPEDIHELRRRLHASLGSSPGPRRRLLISRGDAVERKIRNEAELLSALNDLGFERVMPGELSFADQARLFADAEVIVGPHGAGLTNILFAPPDCKVVELSIESHYSPSYLMIASILGQPYGYVRCPSDRRDLVVDPGGVRTVLEALGRSAADAR